MSQLLVLNLKTTNREKRQEDLSNHRLKMRKKLGLFAPAVSFQASRVIWIQPNPD